eukprot:TRINITY_DN1675_c0_g1_i1.p1 TRINITY_DN1675_c0_g1~~TRINITY_DN1675_c0_g1_i1.p1  ORF type:complete len:256 (-),score=62.44 TRINITY_DN1675_c0_g1_i1:164-931(-)
MSTADEEKRRSKLRKIFDRADEDGNGSLDKKEVRHLIRRVFRSSNVDFNSKFLSKYTELHFNAKDGKAMSFEEFMLLYDKLMTDPDIPEEMKNGAKATETEKLTKQQDELPPLTEEQRETYRQTFDMFDADKSGAIDADELGAVMKKLGVNLKSNDLKKMIKVVDIDGNGEIDFNEFLVMMQSIKTDSQQEIKRAFKSFDVDSDGKISRDDLRVFLEKIEGTLPDEDLLNEMMKVGDPKGTGYVTFSSFRKLVKD